jgi:hypothetical protein
MKKFIIILTVLIAVAFKTNAQIPNNGFESWNTVGHCIEPASWYSMYSLMDSSGIYCPISRSTDHYPASVGQYSAVIANDTSIWNTGISPGYFLGWGMLGTSKMSDRPLFPVSGHPKSLCGYYKFLPQNGDTMNIYLHLYYHGAGITEGKFQSIAAVSTWTSFKFFVPDTLYSNVDSARISVSSSNEPKNGHGGPHGNSILYIDNLSFDTLITSPVSVSELSVISPLFKLYPNPASHFITLNINNINNNDLTLYIYDIMGVLVRSELLNQNQRQINIENLSNGVFMVSLKSKDLTENQKLIIQK